jgi:hypothetical protein
MRLPEGSQAPRLSDPAAATVYIFLGHAFSLGGKSAESVEVLPSCQSVVHFGQWETPSQSVKLNLRTPSSKIGCQHREKQ